MKQGLARGCCAVLSLAIFTLILNYYYWVDCGPNAKQIFRPISNGLTQAKRFDVLETSSKVIFGYHKIVPSHKNIFFVETSCSIKRQFHDGLKLTAKQACAIYSAAFHNPARHVILFYTCPVKDNFYSRSSATTKAVLDLPNFSMVEVNLTSFYSGTPLSSFLGGILDQSDYPVEHNADLLRILVVYLYGGTYMDLDVISIRPLDGLGTNFIGAQEFSQLGTGILNFDVNHGYLRDILLMAINAYDPRAWAAVGPVLATSVLRRYCNITEEVNLETVGYIPACKVRVNSPKTFYPVRYSQWGLYYDSDAWERVEQLLNETYVVHVWNHMSSPDAKILVGSDQPYGKLAEQHCTAVYSRSGQYFR